MGRCPQSRGMDVGSRGEVLAPGPARSPERPTLEPLLVWGHERGSALAVAGVPREARRRRSIDPRARAGGRANDPVEAAGGCPARGGPRPGLAHARMSTPFRTSFMVPDGLAARLEATMDAGGERGACLAKGDGLHLRVAAEGLAPPVGPVLGGDHRTADPEARGPDRGAASGRRSSGGRTRRQAHVHHPVRREPLRGIRDRDHRRRRRITPCRSWPRARCRSGRSARRALLAWSPHPGADRGRSIESQLEVALRRTSRLRGRVVEAVSGRPVVGAGVFLGGDFRLTVVTTDARADSPASSRPASSPRPSSPGMPPTGLFPVPGRAHQVEVAEGRRRRPPLRSSWSRGTACGAPSATTTDAPSRRPASRAG